MPPKGLSDWLTDSDEEEKAPPPKAAAASKPPPVPLSTPTLTAVATDDKNADIPLSTSPSHASAPKRSHAEELRLRRQELEERMKSALGANAVLAKPAAATPAPAAAPHRPGVSAAKSVFDSFTSDEGGPISTLPPTAPSAKHADQLRQSGSSPGPGAKPPTAPHGGHRSSFSMHGGHTPFDEDDYFEVMVADRGTQTVTEVQTQTDPVLSLPCDTCYHATYGHPPPSYGCPHSQGDPRWQGGLQYPPAAAFMQPPPMRRMSVLPTAAPVAGVGYAAGAGGAFSPAQLQGWLTRLETMKKSIDVALTAA